MAQPRQLRILSCLLLTVPCLFICFRGCEYLQSLGYNPRPTSWSIDASKTAGRFLYPLTATPTAVEINGTSIPIVEAWVERRHTPAFSFWKGTTFKKLPGAVACIRLDQTISDSIIAAIRGGDEDNRLRLSFMLSGGKSMIVFDAPTINRVKETIYVYGDQGKLLGEFTLFGELK